MRKAVIVAKRDQWTQVQLNIRARIRTRYPIFNHRRVLALHHEHRFFDFDPGNLKEENRKWIEAEFLQQPESLGMDRAGIAIRSQLKLTAIYHQRLLKLRQQNEPSYRWLGRGNQQPVVAPRVASRNRRRRETANAVSLQPFTTGSGIQVVTNCFSESNHVTLHHGTAAVAASQSPPRGLCRLSSIVRFAMARIVSHFPH